MVHHRKIKAAIDIGTNTIRLLILKNPMTDKEEILVNKVSTVRLGKNIHSTGNISVENLDLAAAALKQYKSDCARFSPGEILAAATEAVRKANNQGILMDKFKEIFGFLPEITSGEEEAEILRFANEEFQDIYGQFILFDIGGGSTEIILESSEHPSFFSIPIGVLRIFEKDFNFRISLDSDAYDKITEEIKKDLGFLESHLPMEYIPVIGTGGTTTTLISIFKGLKEYNHYKVHNSHIPLEEIDIIFQTLNAVDLESRKRIKGMDPERADILLPGILIVRGIMEVLGENKLIVSDKGILFGLIYRSLNPQKE